MSKTNQNKPVHVNHHSYETAGVTDNQILATQAEWRRDHRGETTVVHAHEYQTIDGLQLCNSDCKIYEPGYLTRSIAVERTPVEEEQY